MKTFYVEIFIENHQIVFIFGDLNYRISLPNEIVRPAILKGEYA